MPNPITVLTCEICRQEFRVEMTRNNRSSCGYTIPSTNLNLYYGENEMKGCTFDCVCPACASAIGAATKAEIVKQRPKREVLG